MAILPFYVDLLAEGGGGGFGFLRVLRLARVFRVFKMGKYNKGMQLVSRVMAQSAPALQLMLFFTFLGMVLFGSMLYFCELGTFGFGFRLLGLGFGYGGMLCCGPWVNALSGVLLT